MTAKGSFCLQNSALIAILIVEGREVVFRKACDELCRVVGSAKTRNRTNTRKKRRKGFWCLFCVSGQTLQHGSDRFTTGSDLCCGFCLKCAGIPQTEFASKLCLFSSASRYRETLEKRQK